jgi:hypothetical protein
MANIDKEAFKKAWFNLEEIDSIEKGLNDIEDGKTISHNKVKILARKKIFSDSNIYV